MNIIYNDLARLMECMAYIKHNLMSHSNCCQWKLSQQFSHLWASFSLIFPPSWNYYAYFVRQTENITTMRGEEGAFFKGLPNNTIIARQTIVRTTANRWYFYEWYWRRQTGRERKEVNREAKAKARQRFQLLRVALSLSISLSLSLSLSPALWKASQKYEKSEGPQSKWTDESSVPLKFPGCL